MDTEQTKPCPFCRGYGYSGAPRGPVTPCRFCHGMGKLPCQCDGCKKLRSDEAKGSAPTKGER